MAENQQEVAKEIVENQANPDANLPIRKAVPAQPSEIKNDAQDLGPAVVKPDAPKYAAGSTAPVSKVSDAQNAKADEGDASGNPDTPAGTTKIDEPLKGKMAEEGYKMKKEEDEEKKDDMKKEMSDDEEKKKDMKAEDIDLSDDVKALIGDDNLTEEFKEKARVVFESAVKSRLKEATAKIEESYNAKLSEETETIKGQLVEKVDSYLNYVVEEWMSQNELAIERGIKGEIAEDFISGLKKLFAEHYIDVPDEKYNVLEDQANKIEELENKLNESIEKNVELNKEIGVLTKKDIVEETASDLAETQKEKFNKLAEEIEYSNSEEFAKKLGTLKESYFGASKSSKEISSADGIDNVAVGETTENVDLSNAMTAYTAAISKTKKPVNG